MVSYSILPESDRLVAGVVEMQRDMQVEVILCPNCEEEVPKTLYCLNCGYPLYKVEEEQEHVEAVEAETVVVEEAPEPIEAEPSISQVTEPVVSAIVEEVPEVPSESFIEEVDIEETPEIVPVAEAEEPEETEELVEIVETEAEIVEEAMEVPEPELVEEVYEEPEPEVSAAEEEPHEIIEEEPTESMEEIAEEIIEESMEVEEAEIVEDIEVAAVEVQEETVEFEPDPLTTMVMENLLKNISLKVRLVNLLRRSDVKEATFNKLFESYAAKGERWMNQRNEMLELCRYNLDSMEKKLSEAKTGLEELEIRKAIDDATEEEYLAKAPAFEWDINVLEGELRRRNGEIAFIEDLTRVMPADEIQRLTEMAENCYEAVEGLVDADKITSETAERVKAALQESIDCLKGKGR